MSDSDNMTIKKRCRKQQKQKPRTASEVKALAVVEAETKARSASQKCETLANAVLILEMVSMCYYRKIFLITGVMLVQCLLIM